MRNQFAAQSCGVMGGVRLADPTGTSPSHCPRTGFNKIGSLAKPVRIAAALATFALHCAAYRRADVTLTGQLRTDSDETMTPIKDRGSS